MAGKEYITFLTDFGLENKFVGVCHGVMARIAPGARVLDVTHLVPCGNVRHGAEILRQAIRYLPSAVHVGVVDPGVGTARRAVVLEAGNNIFVGPDNGLLVPAAEEAGGIDRAYAVSNARFRLSPVSNTFHGRDVFSPAGAHLANGVQPEELGPPVAASELVRLRPAVCRREGGTLHGEVMIEDRFGNLQTSLEAALLADMGARVGSKLVVATGGSQFVVPYVDTFGSVAEGDPLAHIDSADRLAFAVNMGLASETFTLHEGDTFRVQLS